MDTEEKFVVFTDLDGSLLDHHSYDFSPALKMLGDLNACNIPVIPVTSKTLSEIDALQLPIGSVPKIGENGMVIDIPAGFFPAPNEVASRIAFGTGYDDILAFIKSLPPDLRGHINGFHDMRMEDIARYTGLSMAVVPLAKNRIGSEPFLWAGSDVEMEDLQSRAVHQNLKITRGGRFYHLMSAGGKDAAMRWVIENLQKMNPETKIISIALGDGPNDADMIAAADIGIIIPNASGHSFEISNPAGQIIRAPAPGPAGWSASLSKAFGPKLDKWAAGR